MAITNSKDILKEFNLALRHFRCAIKAAKRNLIIGEVNFQTASKPVRVRKSKEEKHFAVASVSKDLPDLDKNGYMKERKNPTKDEVEK